jgi:GTP cyclohydrolase I
MRPTGYHEVPAELRNHCDHVVGEIAQGLPMEHWSRTPDRFARYLTHLTRCDDYDRWTTFVTDAETHQLVTVPAIHFWGACSHHMLPFMGQCWVGYIPNKKIIGLSKIPLLVREVARGFWMQEDLTAAIYRRLNELVSPAGAGVHIRAVHTCQLLDVGPPVPEMITTELHGLCLHGPAKEEFLGWCRA